jgi:hypothetical protein
MVQRFSYEEKLNPNFPNYLINDMVQCAVLIETEKTELPNNDNMNYGIRAK